MKDKILKAIDKGLMNALSTDIYDQDIDFDHSDISNDASRQSEMDFAVENILRKCYETDNGYLKNIKKDCMTILECHQYGYKYHVRSLDDLQKLIYAYNFQGLNDAIISGIGTLSWIDTTNIITYVASDGITEIDLSEYNSYDKKPNYQFIKLYSDKFKFGYVLINKWAFTYTQKVKFSENPVQCDNYKALPKDAENDFNGYGNTQNLLKTDNNTSILKNIKANIKLIKNNYGTANIDAYIPAAGEMKLIDRYYPIIYHMIKS